jgi:uncharacterized protein involved in type VI secretion and phage assembly
MSALLDSISRIARHEAAARAIAAVGTVAEIFPADGASPDHAASVELRDSRLLLPRVPIAVGTLGLAAIPAVGDLVIVVFLDGDVNAPVIIGRLYHPDLDPPKHSDGQLVLALPPGASEPDLRLQIDDSPALKLTMPGELTIEAADEQVTIQVGKIQLRVTSAGGGRAEIAAGGAAITLKQDGDITISTQGNLKLEATEITISGSAKVSIKGAQVELN